MEKQTSKRLSLRDGNDENVIEITYTDIKALIDMLEFLLKRVREKEKREKRSE